MTDTTTAETPNPFRDKFKDLDAEGLELLLSELPRWMVGDGKRPNVFFVSNAVEGKVVAVFMGDDKEDDAIHFADAHDAMPLTVEDRLTGVVHDNEAGERLQRQCGLAEDGEWHEDYCPHCESDNIANEDAPDEDGQLHVTCHDCTYQWTEEGHEPEEDENEDN